MARQNSLMVWLIWACLLGGVISLQADESEVPFSIGERLTYNVKWGIIPIGTAVLWVRNLTDYSGRKAFHITAEGRSNAFLSLFYEVDDLIQTLWDGDTFHSLAFQKIQNEGRHHINELYFFDSKRKKVIWFNSKRESKEFDIPEQVQDALSCLYELRRIGFSKKNDYSMNVHQDEKNYQLKIGHLKRDKIKVAGLGRVKTVQVEPLAEHEGVFMRRGSMWVWFTDDKERIPVKVKVKASIFGDLSAELIEKEMVLEPQPSSALTEIRAQGE